MCIASILSTLAVFFVLFVYFLLVFAMYYHWLLECPQTSLTKSITTKSKSNTKF